MKTTNGPSFVVLQIEDTERVTLLIGKRVLQLRDAAVLLALMGHVSTYSGRIKATSKLIAQQLQMQETDVRASFSRLKQNQLLRQIRNEHTGERYYRLNPWMVRASGEGKVHGLSMKEFEEA